MSKVQSTPVIPTQTGRQSNGSNIMTDSFTMASGSNGLLIVDSMCNAADSITGITFNGVALTLADVSTLAGNSKLYRHYLVNPSVGTFNIVTTMNGAFKPLRSAFVSWTGATYGRTVQIPNDASSPLSYSLTGVTLDSALLCAAHWTLTGGTTTIGIDAVNQTKVWTLANTWTSYACIKDLVAAGTRVIDTTWTTGGSQQGLITEILEAGGGGSPRRRCMI
jgi:hypothetical protein